MGIDTRLDITFYIVNEYFNRGKFEEVDRLLTKVLTFMDNGEVSQDELIGWLAATLPAASKLTTRKYFYDRVELYLRLNNKWEDGLLNGLEQK
jgi:hypothetical protein